MANMTIPLTNTAASINRYTRLNLKHDGNGFHARTLAFGGGGVIGVFAPAYEQVKLAESRQRPKKWCIWSEWLPIWTAYPKLSTYGIWNIYMQKGYVIIMMLAWIFLEHVGCIWSTISFQIEWFTSYLFQWSSQIHMFVLQSCITLPPIFHDHGSVQNDQR